jgi:MGT family glycosyltransferase
MKVLVYTAPIKGHLFPTVPIMLELHRRGHDVVVYTVPSEVPLLRDLGLKAHEVDSAITAIEVKDYTGRSPMDSLTLGTRAMVERGRIDGPELRTAIDQEQPDVVVADVLSWGASAVAETSGLPWAIIQHAPTPLPAPEVPPFGPGLKPMGGRLGRLRNRVLMPFTLGAVERSLVPPLNELRAWFGAEPIDCAADLFSRPPLTLYLTSKDLDYPRADWPDSFAITGPLNWDPPATTPAWIDALSRPVALVTTSSAFQDDGELVRTSLAGLAHEDLDVVATMPAGVEPQDVPANAHLEEFVPHSLLLPKAVVAITHGGFGATQKALSSGVPVVVVPFGRDQAEVARRVEWRGLGVVLRRKKLTSETIREAVTRARGLTPTVREFAERMKSEGGAALAADRLEQLARE